MFKRLTQGCALVKENNTSFREKTFHRLVTVATWNEAKVDSNPHIRHSSATLGQPQAFHGRLTNLPSKCNRVNFTT